jgi:hypothetical protein
MRHEDLSKQTFNRLYVESYAGKRRGLHRWNCVCSCGTPVVVSSASLKSGNTKSCGCLNRDRPNAFRLPAHIRGSYFVSTLIGIKARCNNPKAENYARYGGKGTRLCRGWSVPGGVVSFAADMGERPSTEYTVDRIDTTGHYSCGHCDECVANGWRMNCRWATPIEQGSNKTNNLFHTEDGVTKTYTEWERFYDLPYGQIHRRIRLGWTFREAVEKPVQVHELVFRYRDEDVTLTDLAEKYGVDRERVYNQVYRGKTIDEAMEVVTRSPN